MGFWGESVCWESIQQLLTFHWKTQLPPISRVRNQLTNREWGWGRGGGVHLLWSNDSKSCGLGQGREGSSNEEAECSSWWDYTCWLIDWIFCGFLGNFHVSGVETNIEFLRAILSLPSFSSSEYPITTSFLDTHKHIVDDHMAQMGGGEREELNAIGMIIAQNFPRKNRGNLFLFILGSWF